METELYQKREWPEHVRMFYAEWLKETGYRAENARAFDRFVELMEQQIGDFLMDQCADHSGIGIIPEEDE
jgi:hypothetical protein